MKAWLGPIVCLSILGGCFKPIAGTEGVVSQLPGMSPDKDSAGGINVGKVSSIINPNSTVAQTIKSETGGAISGTSVTFPPGALAIAATMVVEQAYPLSESSVLTELGIDATTKVTNAAAAVIVRPSVDINLNQPMTLQIPAPALSLALSGEENVAILYRVWKGSTDGLESGVIPANELKVENGFVAFKTQSFGAFQAVKLTVPIKEKVTVKTEEPIHNVSGVAVVEKSGYVPEQTILAAEQVQPLEFSSMTFGYNDAALAFTYTATLKRNETVSACRMRIERSDGQTRFIDVASLSGRFARAFAEGAKIRAQLSCTDASKRILTSNFSNQISIPEITLGVISAIVKIDAPSTIGTSTQTYTSTSTGTTTSTGTATTNPGPADEVKFTATYTGPVGLKSCAIEIAANNNFAAIAKTKTIDTTLKFALNATELTATTPYFRIRCLDEFGRAITRTLDGTVEFAPSLHISPTTAYVSYSKNFAQFTPAGGKPPYSWQVVGQDNYATHEKFNINPDGYLSGASYISSGRTWTVRLTDSSGKSVDALVRSIDSLSVSVHDVRMGQLAQFSINGGIPPFSATITSGSGSGAIQQITTTPASLVYQAPNTMVPSVTIRVEDATGNQLTVTFRVRGPGEIDPSFTDYGSNKTLSTSAAPTNTFSNQMYGFTPLANGTYLFGGDSWVCCSPEKHYFGTALFDSNFERIWGNAFDISNNNGHSRANVVIPSADQNSFYLLGSARLGSYDRPVITRHSMADGAIINNFGDLDADASPDENSGFQSGFLGQVSSNTYIYGMARFSSQSRVYRYAIATNGALTLDRSFGDGSVPIELATNQILTSGDNFITVGKDAYGYPLLQTLTMNNGSVVSGGEFMGVNPGSFVGAKIINGKLYAYGYSAPGTTQFMVARFTINASGALTADADFGTEGFIVNDITSGVDIARDIAVQPDGKLLVLITADEKPTPNQKNGRVEVRRYNLTGTPDGSFPTTQINAPGDYLSYLAGSIHYRNANGMGQILVTYYTNNTANTNIAAIIP